MFSPDRFRELAALVGVELNVTSHGEKGIAATGALVSLLAVSWISFAAVSGPGAGLLLASMGASAVLLFVVPHGALSQPWPLVVGHLVSAAIGVGCQRLLPEQAWVPAFAVGLAIAVMQYLRCVHPPGGATALVAVIGGPDIEALGFRFLLDPVLLNVASLLLIAVLFNNLFGWRQYPAHLMKKRHAQAQPAFSGHQQLRQEDFEAAMHQMNTFIDVNTDDLIELVDLATIHAEEQHAHPAGIRLGHCYSNGRLGRSWSVRQVIDQQAPAALKPRAKVIYKTLAGEDVRSSGISTYEDFRQWARFEVAPVEGRWVRVQEAVAGAGRRPAQ